MNSEGVLYYREIDGNIYIRALGHIRAAICTDLQKKVFRRLENTPPPKKIFVDLSRCNYMDSTFMGLLVGFNKVLKHEQHEEVEILNPKAECDNLLKGLGVRSLFKISHGQCILPTEMELVSKSEKAPAELLLEAHDNLINVSDENRTKFGALRSLLKQQVKDNSDKD